MRVRTIALVALLGVSVATGAERPRGLWARAHHMVDNFHRVRAANAAGTSQVFSQVDVANSAGTVVASMGSDDVGAGGSAVFDNGGGLSALTLVDDDGSGAFAAFNTRGTGGYALHGTLGLVGFGGDVAEVFPSAGDTIAKGAVMSLDPDRPGMLRLASQPYDRKVAGVVAGAKDYRSAVTLRGSANVTHGIAVTLSGTVYCLATSANGPIRVGDLLTTSAVPGHAMRATDPESSRGAVLGKAMENSKGDRGLILLLASLQ